MSRRTLLAGAAGGAAGAAAALSGCSSKSVTEKLDEAQAEAIEQVDTTTDRLPLGSVVRAFGATWMIAGQGVVSIVGAGDGVASGQLDYYAVKWPRGAGAACVDAEAFAVINKEDVTELLFVGLVNEEDEDMRQYAEEHLSWDGNAESHALSNVSVREGKLRLEGYRSEELYGEEYGTGIMYDSEALAEIFGEDAEDAADDDGEGSSSDGDADSGSSQEE